MDSAFRPLNGGGDDQVRGSVARRAALRDCRRFFSEGFS